jgi:pheromone shutdown protein TraB
MKLRKEKEQDLDIKQELKKGNIVTIIYSTLDY